MISLYNLFEQDEELEDPAEEDLPDEDSDDTSDEEEAPAKEVPKGNSGGLDAAMATLGDQLYQKATELKQQLAQQAEEEEEAAAEEAEAEREEAENAQAEEEAEKQKAATRIKAKVSELITQDPEHQKITAADQIMNQIAGDAIKKMAEKIVPAVPVAPKKTEKQVSTAPKEEDM